MVRRRPRSNSSWSDHERLRAGAPRHHPDPRARPTVGGRPPGRRGLVLATALVAALGMFLSIYNAAWRGRREYAPAAEA